MNLGHSSFLETQLPSGHLIGVSKLHVVLDGQFYKSLTHVPSQHYLLGHFANKHLEYLSAHEPSSHLTYPTGHISIVGQIKYE